MAERGLHMNHRHTNQAETIKETNVSTETPTEQCHHPKVPHDSADARRVADVMVTRPKTLPADATVADLRRLFANPHVISALLVDGSAFAGIVNRDEVSASADDALPAAELANRDVTTLTRSASVADAMAVLAATGDFRVVVLEEDGATLAGLVCLDQPRTGFCQ